MRAAKNDRVVLAQSVVEKDVVVVGSGGAGLTAATVAARLGLDVLLTEKTDLFGGTTAFSGGGIWVPRSSLALQAGIVDEPGAAQRYVREVVGPSVRMDLLDAFLAAAPRMVDYLQTHTSVRFGVQRGFADWHPHAAGFLREGRLLTPIDYDGRELGPYFETLRPPLREFNAPAGMMIGLGDMGHAMQMTRSWQSFRHMSRLLVRFGVDRLGHSRGTRLTMGNALAARLLRSALDAKVTLWREAPMQRLIVDAGAVVGVVIRQGDRDVEVRTRRGVVLASGGFSANAQMRSRYIPYPEHHVSLVSNGNTGDGINEAVAAGGQFDGDNLSNAGWVVVSLLRAADGSIRKFPHLFLDRGKPGCIAVNREGKRFGNESASNLVEPMHRSGSVPAYLLCDHAFIRRYGLGFVRPGGWGLRRMLAAGYLVRADSLNGLADRLQIPAQALNDTVRRFNAQAQTGVDADFGRGSDKADFALGDPTHQPNPCLGPILQPPFYAVEIHPGDSTTTVGLRVDAYARVVGPLGVPIPGLHAIGLDMNSLWRGRAPGHGANNTLSLSFGFLAAECLAGVKVSRRPAATAA